MKSSLGNMIIRLSKKVLAAALAGMVLATAMPGMSVDAKTSNSTNSAANEAAVPGASSAISENAKKEVAQEEAHLVMEYMDGSSYNSKNPLFFWGCIYGYICDNPTQCKAVEKGSSAEIITVDKAVVEQVAAGLFPGCTMLLPKPAEFVGCGINVDPDDPGRYILYLGDGSPYDYKLKSWKDNGNGTYEAQYEVTDWTEEEQRPFCIETVTYCDNKYSAGGAKPFLPISMTNAVVQDRK